MIYLTSFPFICLNIWIGMIFPSHCSADFYSHSNAMCIHNIILNVYNIYIIIFLFLYLVKHQNVRNESISFLFPQFFQTLLDLGVSPNLKDSRSLTPLYYTVSHCTSPSCMEMLLQERAFIGSQDEQGWFEIHHVRRLLL